jgi:hypothetical protein
VRVSTLRDVTRASEANRARGTERDLALEIVGIVVAVLLIAGTVLRFARFAATRCASSRGPWSDDWSLRRRHPTHRPRVFVSGRFGRATDRPPLERPRLDPARQYVFSDSQHSEESSATARSPQRRLVSLAFVASLDGSLVARRLVARCRSPSSWSRIVTYAVESSLAQSSHAPQRRRPRPARPTTTAAEHAARHVAQRRRRDLRRPGARYRVTVTGSGGRPGPSTTWARQHPRVAGTVTVGKTSRW